MKQFFTFSFVCFIALGKTLGQYEPMAVEGAHWVIFSTTDQGLNHHAIVIEGDTTLNGATYMKVYRREIEHNATIPQDFLPPFYAGLKELIALIRDDSSLERVYSIFYQNSFPECNVGEEELIYDFSLSQGMLLAGCLNEDQGIPFAGIDSLKIEFLWGKEREVQYVTTGYKFIEGIGGDSGPFSTSADVVPGFFNSIVDYCIGADDDCNFLTVNTNEVTETVFKIYPNPASSLLKIEAKYGCNEVINVALFDMGNKISNDLIFDCKSLNPIEINLSGITNGVYFLKIKSNRFSLIHKIIVF